MESRKWKVENREQRLCNRINEEQKKRIEQKMANGVEREKSV